MNFPSGKKFAFTVFDDTDNATVGSVKPVYDLLYRVGMRTTKSVWVYPPRGKFVGGSLQEADYLAFIRELQDRNFEIGLHNVGDGHFSREEIISGINEFREKLGHFPSIHANHVSNPDNLYWWDKRFEWPISVMYRYLSGRGAHAGGEDPLSETFWGDIAKERIRHIRNLTFNDINTLAVDPRMPYQVRHKAKYSNLWFSSSDGHTIEEFNELISPRNVDRLAAEGGACIVYTHFSAGFVSGAGVLDATFVENIEYLVSKDGWFVPVGRLLDFLATRGTSDPGYLYRLGTNIKWLLQRRAKKRRFGR